MEPSKVPENAANYEKENQLLRQLYEERQKRKKQEQGQQHNQIEELLTKQIKQQSTKQALFRLYLNCLIYDKRKNKPAHIIRLPSFFQENPQAVMLGISENIQSIFISTFGFQMEVMIPLATCKAKLTVLNHSDEKGQSKVINKYNGYENMTVIEKKKSNNAYGVFHAKLWLIKFKNFLRVVISTSNMHIADWSHWQNAYWFQDFWQKKQQDKIQKKTLQLKHSFNYDTDFAKTLQAVLIAMIPNQYSLKNELGIQLSNYLFTNIKVILIPSIPGSYSKQQIQQQGLGKIEHVIKQHKRYFENPVLSYNTTSLGVVDDTLCESIYKSFAPNKQYKEQNFQLIYPTASYISNQTCGEAQVLFLLSNNYQKSNKNIFYQFKENPQNFIKGCIPHLKTVIVQDQKQTGNCIFYVGSHNMTKAAWGTFTGKNKSNLRINNFELGLLFIEQNTKEIKKWVPYQYPPKKYQPQTLPFLRDLML